MNAVVEQLPVRRDMVTGGSIRAVVPQSMEDAYRLAKAVCVAGMAPRGLDTPEKCMVAILHGMEVGLAPMAALQRIAVVNGRPTIWGDGAIGLVRASGLCDYVRETIEGEGDQRVARCETKRRGEAEPIVRTFSVADAKKAGLWGKQGPWQQYPDRMQQMRARAFALRDGYADVLGGMYLREELDGDEQEHHQRDVSPQPPRIPANVTAAIAAPGEEAVEWEDTSNDHGHEEAEASEQARGAPSALDSTARPAPPTPATTEAAAPGAGGDSNDNPLARCERELREAAAKGEAALILAWNRIHPSDQKGLVGLKDRQLKPIAREADQKRSQPQEDDAEGLPF